MDVRLSLSVAIHDQSPIQPLQDGVDWQVIERYNNHIGGICEWTLRAVTEDTLNQAQTLIDTASDKARRANCIGFLAFLDNTKFGLIIGRNGETIQKLQHDTQTTIIVPKMAEKNCTIEITGMSQRHCRCC
jgi:hypothetical protein